VAALAGDYLGERLREYPSAGRTVVQDGLTLICLTGVDEDHDPCSTHASWRLGYALSFILVGFLVVTGREVHSARVREHRGVCSNLLTATVMFVREDSRRRIRCESTAETKRWLWILQRTLMRRL
jgi:hypothetical protein